MKQTLLVIISCIMISFSMACEKCTQVGERWASGVCLHDFKGECLAENPSKVKECEQAAWEYCTYKICTAEDLE